MSSDRESSKPILLLDVGNTNLKWCWLEHGALSPIEHATHRDFGVSSIGERNWRSEKSPGRILVSNVMGAEMERSLSEWTVKAWGVRPEFVRCVKKAGGVTNAYTDPAQLGVDRWLTLIAVFNQKGRAACVVDSGTATTIDVIDKNGVHLGGMILPGLDLMRESLLARTRIPRVDAGDTGLLLAKDTATAVASAGINATAALVERAIRQVRERLGGEPRLILTGSSAGRIASALHEPHEVEPELIMIGLAVLAEEAGSR